MTYLALPFEPTELEGMLAAVFDLAATLHVVTIERTYGLAHRTAIGPRFEMPSSPTPCCCTFTAR
jgi:hypothetical protein